MCLPESKRLLDIRPFTDAEGIGRCHLVLEPAVVRTDWQPRRAFQGWRYLREADAPPHGGFRGYVSDPDGHAWEIAYNPAWTIDENGLVTFGV